MAYIVQHYTISYFNSLISLRINEVVRIRNHIHVWCVYINNIFILHNIYLVYNVFSCSYFYTSFFIKIGYATMLHTSKSWNAVNVHYLVLITSQRFFLKPKNQVAKRIGAKKNVSLTFELGCLCTAVIICQYDGT